MISFPFFVTTLLVLTTTQVKATNEHRPKIIAGYQPMSSMALANVSFLRVVYDRILFLFY